MPTLPNFHHFAGSHWESGTLHNVYAYLGVKAPHTGEPYSEALLLGSKRRHCDGLFQLCL